VFPGIECLELALPEGWGIQPKVFFGACGVRDGFSVWVKPGSFFALVRELLSLAQRK
jgi:hypothetical protein